MKLRVVVLTSQPYYPQSHTLLGVYCTQPEVKFDTFIRLKRGEEKLIRNLFLDFYTRDFLFIEQIKNVPCFPYVTALNLGIIKQIDSILQCFCTLITHR